MTADLYDGDREQTRAKHDLLKAYLRPLAYKILQGRVGSLDFIDGFAGPWESRDTAFTDTSFGIAVEILAGVQGHIAGSGRPPPAVRCIFNEADPLAFERLRGYVDEARQRHPGLDIVSLQGRFDANAAEMNRLARNAFRLVFIDPTGWTGYPRDALMTLVSRAGFRPGAEVMINFMSSFVDRFFRTPEDRRNAWLEELLGPDRASWLRAEKATEAVIRRQIAAMLREDLALRYVCESPIVMSQANKIHFWMLYGTRSPMGVVVLRDSEFKALGSHEETRDKRQRSGQGYSSISRFPAPFPTCAKDILPRSKVS
ncbi:MAG: three-Cys-motif partner protein TcmP [Azospirillaceae bacterium]